MKRLPLAILLVLPIAALGFYFKSRQEAPVSSTIRVAFPYDKPARFYEPTRIHLAPEYIFLENTFSPLVELSPADGHIRPGIAESWSWNGNTLRLKIRPGLHTIDGHPITAHDAEFSLKRLLVKTGNTHGNFQSLVCGAREIRSINDSCPGIRVEGADLVIEVKSKSAFVLPMLAGIDFAVIPKRSVNPKTLEIKDYRNTSGPYYVSKDDENGQLELSLHHGHFHASEKIPQKVLLVPVDRADKTSSLRLFKRGEVDLITTIDAARPEEVIALAKEIPLANLHTTANIRSIVLLFTDRGLRELSETQRLAIGERVRESLLPHFASLPGYAASSQYYPSFGDGALAENTVQELAARHFPSANVEKLPLSLTTVRVGDVSVFKSLLATAFPHLQVSEGANVPAFSKYEKPTDMPHMAIGGPDTGYAEDISLISYSLVSGMFGMAAAERTKWLANYMAKPEKNERLKALREIHDSSIRHGVLVPLLACPYTALAQHGWKIELSQIFANNPLWLIKHL